MPEEIVITVNDQETGDTIQSELHSRGLSLTRLPVSQAPRFGMRLQTPLGSLEASATEIIQLVVATPSMVDAVLDIIDRLKGRSKVYVNGRIYDRLTKPKKSGLEWIAGASKERRKRGL